MLDPNTLVRAGGIAPASARTDEKTTAALAAKRFTHPSLGERVVVRLADASLEPAIDAEMNVLGFADHGPSEHVGRTKRRALGFPTWALVHHPKEARFAIEVMRDMRKAAARVKTKPGHARDAFVEIGKKLERSVPMFLPSYWEEAARAFLAEEATAMAAQCFEKARSAERAFKLKVDEDRRAEAYLEFTLLGAVPAKTLAGYAGDLVKSYGAKEGERRFRELNAHRIKGGVPPWTGMGKELRRLAKEAKRSEQEADDDLLREVLDAPAIAKAPVDFWTTYQRSLVRLGASDAKVRDRLFWLFPKPNNFGKLASLWLGILGELDAATRMAESDDAGRWLSQLTSFVTFECSEGLPEVYFSFVETLAPRLKAVGQPVSLESHSHWETAGVYSLDALEAALALGIPVSDPRHGNSRDEDDDDATLDLGDKFVKDPIHLARDARYAPILEEAVARYFGGSDFEECARGKSALRDLRLKCLQKRIDGLIHGGVPTFKEAVESLAEETAPEIWSEFPECARALADVRVAPSLARSLRAGVFDELTWPAFEEALRELKPKERLELEVMGTHRFPIVRRGRKVVVFDGKSRLRSYDLPAVVKTDDVQGLWFLDGDLLVKFRAEDGGRSTSKSLWMSKPKEVLDGSFSIGDTVNDTPLPGGAGGVTLGRAAIHRGDTLSGDQDRHYITDGTHFWIEQTRYDEPGTPRLKLAELDLKTGAAGRASWPALLQEPSERSDGRTLVSASLGVAASGAEHSLFGFANGLHGGFNRRKGRDDHEFVRIDGKTSTTTFFVDGLVSMPGSTTPTPVKYDTAYSNDDDQIDFLDSTGASLGRFGDSGWRSTGLFRLPRIPWLHFLSARDEAGSRALRELSDDSAETPLDAARVDIEDGDGDDDDDSLFPPKLEATEAAIAKSLPTLTNAELRRSVANIVGAARRAELKLGSLVDQGAGAGAGSAGGKGPTDDDVKSALLFSEPQGYPDGFAVADMTAAAAFFRGGDPGSLTQSSVGWEVVVDQWPKLLCFLASRATLTEAHRKTLRSLVEGLAESGLLGLPLVCAFLSVTKGAEFLKRGKHKDCWFFVEGSTRMFARATVEDDDEPAFKVTVLAANQPPHGAPLPLPKGATLIQQEEVTIPDAKDFVETFLKLLDQRGPAPFDKAAPAVMVADAGGALKPAEATLLLAGFLEFDETYKHDFLGKAVRTTLDIKVNEAKAARDRLFELNRATLRAIMAQGADVASPASFWAPSDAADGVARSIARAAAKVLGAVRRHPEALVQALESEIEIEIAPVELLNWLMDEKSPLWIPRSDVAWSDLGDHGNWLHGGVVTSYAHALAHFALHLPAGDEYRAALPKAYRRLRTLLDAPELLFRAGEKSVDDDKKRAALLEQFGGKAVEIQMHRQGKKGPARDTGLLVLIDDQSCSIELAIRPSKVAGARAELERVLAMGGGDDGVGWSDNVGAALLFLTSKGCEELVARIEKSPVPDGRHEGDPRASVPKLVSAVKKELGLDDDAATLYLQTLALPHPTQKLLCNWNGWTPAQYKQAVAALVKKKGLVIEGKRDRAGRDIFLPGGWEKAGGRHVESWKLAMLKSLNGTLSVLEPVHALYERAWRRVKDGDAPRFEETRKTKGKGK